MARFDFVSLSSSLAPNQRSVLTVLSHDIRTVSLTLLRLPILLGTGLSQDDPSAGILPFSTQAPGEAEVICDGPGEPVWIKAGRMHRRMVLVSPSIRDRSGGGRMFASLRRCGLEWYSRFARCVE